MSTLTPDTAVPAAPTPGLSRTTTRSYKAPIAFAVFTVIAVVLFVVNPREGSSTFRLATATDFFALPDAVLPSAATCCQVASASSIQPACSTRAATACVLAARRMNWASTLCFRASEMATTSQRRRSEKAVMLSPRPASTRTS